MTLAWAAYGTIEFHIAPYLIMHIVVNRTKLTNLHVQLSLDSNLAASFRSTLGERQNVTTQVAHQRTDNANLAMREY